MASTTAADAPPGFAFRAAPEWVIIVCDGRRFALPLARVREILLPRPFTRLPGCGPEVCGLIGLRGRVLTAFDFGAALGLRPAAEQPDHRLLLIEHGERLVAGAVEAVAAIARTATDDDAAADGWRVQAWDPANGAPPPIDEEERRCPGVDPDALLRRLLG